jgi:hypothetical protein
MNSCDPFPHLSRRTTTPSLVVLAVYTADTAGFTRNTASLTRIPLFRNITPDSYLFIVSSTLRMGTSCAALVSDL